MTEQEAKVLVRLGMFPYRDREKPGCWAAWKTATGKRSCVCTLAKGHEGPHVAHIGEYIVLCVWEKRDKLLYANAHFMNKQTVG